MRCARGEMPRVMRCGSPRSPNSVSIGLRSSSLRRLRPPRLLPPPRRPCRVESEDPLSSPLPLSLSSLRERRFFLELLLLPPPPRSPSLPPLPFFVRLASLMVTDFFDASARMPRAEPVLKKKYHGWKCADSMYSSCVSPHFLAHAWRFSFHASFTAFSSRRPSRMSSRRLFTMGSFFAASSLTAPMTFESTSASSSSILKSSSLTRASSFSLASSSSFALSFSIVIIRSFASISFFSFFSSSAHEPAAASSTTISVSVTVSVVLLPPRPFLFSVRFVVVTSDDVAAVTAVAVAAAPSGEAAASSPSVLPSLFFRLMGMCSVRYARKRATPRVWPEACAPALPVQRCPDRPCACVRLQ
eukprot:Rhum_TRINITY_DN14728_c0_g1::Rhum_TRINITY_DN14728_c0_g1_i2::g.111722::m.111722